MIALRNIKRNFGPHEVLKDISFEIPSGQLAVLFGPSGCGKTTLLRIIAGLEHADSGSIHIGDRQIVGSGLAGVKPEDRKVGLVFQDLALFPHLSVERNIQFGIRKSSVRLERTDELLALTHLESLRHRLPHELSGGEQQRVAVARALAPEPDLLLLDEPFANLDATLRSTVRAELIELLDRVGTTSIMVTHDRAEALSAAQTLLVMSEGSLLQTGTPKALYERPRDRKVANLLGDGNLLKCEVKGGKAACCLGVVDAGGHPDGPALIFVRTEHLSVENAADGMATVQGTTYYGHDSIIEIRLDDGTVLRSRRPHDHSVSEETRVRARISGPCTIFAADH